jgi:hypothetical protein
LSAAPKGGLPFHGCVEGGAEGEHVRQWVGRLAPGRLRGQERGGAGQHPGLGHGDIPGCARETEVGDLGGAIFGEQDVAGFDIPVHDPGGVGRGHCRGHRRADPGHPHRRHRPLLGQHRRQAPGRQVLQDQQRLTVGVGGDVVDGHGVGVLQPGGDASLPEHPLPGALCVVRGQIWRDPQLLDRYHPVQPLIGCLPYDAHPAIANRVPQPVAAGEQPTGMVVHDRRSVLPSSPHVNESSAMPLGPGTRLR